MAQVYFIGGAPRVGKTALAMRILKQRPMFAISADGVRDMLRGVLKPLDSPALFAIQKLAKHESAMAGFLRQHPQAGIELQNDESAIVWPSVNELILSHLADGQDILVEGVEILPQLVAGVPYDYRAVFLGNTSKQHVQAVTAQAHGNPHDWMHHYAKGSVEAWAGLVQSFSAYIKAEAAAHQLPYIETRDDDFEQSLAEAQQSLFQGTTIDLR